MKLFFKSTLIFLALLILLPESVLAQQYSLSISPPLVELMIKPGKSLIKAFNVENNGSSDLYLRSRVVPFLAKGEEGRISLLDDDLEIAKLEASGIKLGLINVQPGLGEDFLVRSGEKKQLILKITVLETVKEKDFYFTFLIEQASNGEYISQSGSGAMAKIGSNVLLTVSESGSPSLQGQIGKFRVFPKIADIFDLVNFETIIVNSGTTFFKLGGGVDISNWQGKTIKQFEFRPDNVLAGGKREAVCWQEGQIACQFESGWPGRYKAVINFYPDENSDQILTKEVVFWLLPIKLTIGLVVVLIFGFYIVSKVKKIK